MGGWKVIKETLKFLRTHRPCVYHFSSPRKNHKSWAFRRAFTRFKAETLAARLFPFFHTLELWIHHFQSVVMTKSCEKIFLRMIRLYTGFQWISPRFRIKVARDCFISKWNLLFSTLFVLRPLLAVRFTNLLLQKKIWKASSAASARSLSSFTKTFLQVQIQLWTWQFFNPIYQHQCHSALNFPFLPKNLRQPTHSPVSFSQQVQVLTNAATESIFTRFCWLQPFAVRLRTCTLGFASTSTLEGCWLTSAFRPDDEGKCVCTHSSIAAAGVKAKTNIYASEAINHNHDSMEKHSTLHC